MFWISRASRAARGHGGSGCSSIRRARNARTAQLLAEVAPTLSLGITRVPMKPQADSRRSARHRRLAVWQREHAAEVFPRGHGSKGGAFMPVRFSRRASGGRPCVSIRRMAAASISNRAIRATISTWLPSAGSGAARTCSFSRGRYVARCFARLVGESRRAGRASSITACARRNLNR